MMRFCETTGKYQHANLWFDEIHRKPLDRQHPHGQAHNALFAAEGCAQDADKRVECNPSKVASGPELITK